MVLCYVGEIVFSFLGGWLVECFGVVKVLVMLLLVICVVLVGFGGGLLWLFVGLIVILWVL